MWPSSSSNVNTLDFSVWAHVASEACAKSHSSVSTLKTSVEVVWTAMGPNYIKKCCDCFRSRVEAGVEANGGVFEK